MRNYIIAGVAIVIIIILSGLTLGFREDAINTNVQLESYKTQNKELQKKLDEYEANSSQGVNENQEISIEQYLNILYPDFKIENLQSNDKGTYKDFVKEYKDIYAYIENGKLSLEVISSDENSEIENIKDVSKKAISTDKKVLNVALSEEDDKIICAILFENGTIGYMDLENLFLKKNITIKNIEDVSNIVNLREMIIDNDEDTIIAISKDGKFYDIINLIK